MSHYLAAIALVAAAALPARAQDASVPDPRTYGTASITTVGLASIGFAPVDDGRWTHLPNAGWSWRTAGNDTTCVNVHLPSGARLEGITTYTNDTDATGSITYRLNLADLVTNSGTSPFFFATAGTPGIERVFRAMIPPLVIDNDRKVQSLCVTHSVIGGSLQNSGATLWYRLQVSPAPATATFPSDVPTTHPFFRFIEALAAAGITGGCGAGAYCPDAPVTRGQMAVFLSTALGLHFPN